LIEQANFFAITGGPGAGKTTLLRALQALGEACVEESARALIQEAARGGRPRPRDAELGRLMLERDVEAYQAATGRTFFDRGIVDAAATAAIGGRSPEIEAAVRAYRYNRSAFIAPPWREIYVQDAERTQDWAHAVQVFEICAKAYEAAGYRLVELPLASPEERAAFVLSSLP
jgi:predicted ATPase